MNDQSIWYPVNTESEDFEGELRGIMFDPRVGLLEVGVELGDGLGRSEVFTLRATDLFRCKFWMDVPNGLADVDESLSYLSIRLCATLDIAGIEQTAHTVRDTEGVRMMNGKDPVPPNAYHLTLQTIHLTMEIYSFGLFRSDA